uniref:Uncharacterized protein n=1 Tax=Nelumbo nucifera TaxID=4432 RepID=A0A822XLM7_NELNU|nr:TPA_asm: hypothetical protein HUJ06_022365 [Nelumbo nucifera]
MLEDVYPMCFEDNKVKYHLMMPASLLESHFQHRTSRMSTKYQNKFGNFFIILGEKWDGKHKSS